MPVGSRKIYHRLNIFFLQGRRILLLISEKGFKRFLPAGENIFGNSKCPGCSSLERQRLLWLYLTRKLKIQDQKIKLLNVAPDFAIQSKLKSLSNIDYISIDLESNLAMQKQDLTNLSFSDNYFDAILCYHVLEHIVDDRKAMSELFRVLKPGGWAILQTPIEKDREKTFEDFSILLPQEKKKNIWTGSSVKLMDRIILNVLNSQGLSLLKMILSITLTGQRKKD